MTTTTIDTPTSAGIDTAPPAQFPATVKPQSIGELLSGRPNLAKSLCAAQQAAQSVSVDRENKFHHYHYASAEAILAESRVLSANGLALIPLEETLDGWQRDGPDRFQLVCRYLLLHTSGESLPLLRHWPVCPDKGRPLDKATAAASTLALSYLLRDLLILPRVGREDDVSARDDRPREQRQEKPAKKAPPVNGKELLARLEAKEKKLVAEKVCKAGDLIRHVARVGAAVGLDADISMWGADGIDLATKTVPQFERTAREGGITRPSPPAPAGGQHASSQSSDQDGGGPEPDDGEVIGAPARKEIAALLREAKQTWEWCRKLLELPEEASLTDLTIAQAARLKAALAAKKAS